MKSKEFFMSPLEGFLACDVDETTNVHYYGYMNIFGCWIIMKEDASVAPNVIRYAYGEKSTADYYAINWTNRTSLTYDLPDEVFTELS